VLERPPSLRQRAEFALLRAAATLGEHLTEDAAEHLGARLGRIAWQPLGIRRSLVDAHLRIAFPERDAAARSAIARACYEHLGREMMVLLRMARLTPQQLMLRSELVGAERPLAELARGRGVVVVAGHFGNWELGAAIPAVRGIPIDMIAQRQSNPLFDRYIRQLRHRFGVGVIERSQARRLAVHALRAGRAVVFAADQDARSSGVFVPFFGRPASTHRGPAVLALRTSAMIVLALPIRTEDGHYQVKLEEISVSREGDPDEVVLRITREFTARLEAAVREQPQQYLWQHRRWKSTPRP
jgi:KDO2-lipid IV(A) lauroyltransferase